MFFPFNYLTTHKIKILKKMKKASGDVIALHVYHKGQPSDVWFLIERDRQNVWSFWVIFCPFTLLITQQLNFEKMKERAWRYHLHKCTKNHVHMLCCS